jgi:hypothetical protein
MKQQKALSKFMIFIVVLALLVLSCSGTSGIPGLFITPTATATNTFTPGPTLTPSSTATATPTQTPSPTPLPTGLKLEEHSDGSAVFIDYDNNYQLTLPKDWMVIPLSSDDVATILSKLSEKNPAFKEMAETFKTLDPDVIRAIAMSTDPKYIAQGFSTNITITALEDKLMSSMPLDFVTGAMEQSLQEQGAKILSDSSLAAKNSNGVEIGSFDYEKTTPTAAGTNALVRAKAIVFQVNGKMILIQLATPKQFADDFLSVIEDVSSSIKLLDLGL